MENGDLEGLKGVLAQTLAYRGMGWARKDPDSLADELLEKFPGQQEHVDALVAAIASDVLSALIGATGAAVSGDALAMHAQHLVSEWGLNPGVATWSVNTWLHAISLTATEDDGQAADTQTGSTDTGDRDQTGSRVTGAVSRLRRLRRTGNLTTRLATPGARPERVMPANPRSGRMPVPMPPQRTAEFPSVNLPTLNPPAPPEAVGSAPSRGSPGIDDVAPSASLELIPSTSLPSGDGEGSTEAIPVAVWSVTAQEVPALVASVGPSTALSTVLTLMAKHRLIVFGSLATLSVVTLLVAITPPPPDSGARASAPSPARSAAGGASLPTTTPPATTMSGIAMAATSAKTVAPSMNASPTPSVDALVAASWDRDWVESIRVLKEYLGTRGNSDAYASGKLYDALVQYGIVLVGLQQPGDAIDTWRQAEALDAGRGEAPQRIGALSTRLASQGAEKAQTPENATTATVIATVTPRVSVTLSPVGGVATPLPAQGMATEVVTLEAVATQVAPGQLTAVARVTSEASTVVANGARQAETVVAQSSKETATAEARSAAPPPTVRSTATEVVRSTVAPKATEVPAPTLTSVSAPTAPPVPTPTVPPLPTAPPAPTPTKVPVPTVPPAPSPTQPPAATPVPVATVVLQRIVLEQPAQDFVTTAGAVVEFRWKQVPGARKYRVQMCLTDDCWEELRLDRVTDQVSMSYAPDRSGGWVWRVAAVGENDRLGPWPEFLRRFLAR